MRIILLVLLSIISMDVLYGQVDGKKLMDRVFKEAEKSFDRKNCKPETIVMAGDYDSGDISSIVKVKCLLPDKALMMMDIMGEYFIKCTNENISWEYNPFKGSYDTSKADTGFTKIFQIFDTYGFLEMIKNSSGAGYSDTIIGKESFYKISNNNKKVKVQEAYILVDKKYHVNRFYMQRLDGEMLLTDYDYKGELFVPGKLLFTMNNEKMKMTFTEVKYNEGVKKEEFYMREK